MPTNEQGQKGIVLFLLSSVEILTVYISSLVEEKKSRRVPKYHPIRSLIM